MVQCILSDVPVRVGRLQVSANEVVVDAFLLKVRSQGHDQQVAVGEGVGAQARQTMDELPKAPIRPISSIGYGVCLLSSWNLR